MFRLCRVAVLLSVGVALVAAYSQGPPIQIEGVCTDMFPTGHGVEKQSSDAPYEYVLSQECYKEGVAVHGESHSKFFSPFSI